MERRRNYADRSGAIQSRQIGVALETRQPHLLPRQHSGISGSVRFMTRRTSFKSHWTVLEGERPALIAMTGQAAGFIGSEALQHRRTYRAVWIVAVDATHCAFRQLVVIRALELRPNIEVATGTLLIDGRGFAIHQSIWPIGVNLMTGRAGHLVLHVTAFEASHMRRLVQVTCETDLVGRRRCQLGRVLDCGCVGRFGMLLAGTVAGFARPLLPTPPLLGLDQAMRTLEKRVVNIFMARLAGRRASVSGWQRWLSRRPEDGEQEQYKA